MRITAGIFLFRRLPSNHDDVDGAANYEALMLHSALTKGRWTMPKGHQDPGESLLDCAIRETREEAGLASGEDYRLVSEFEPATFTFPASSNRLMTKQLTLWLAEVTNGQAVVTISDEHRDYRWCRPAECMAKLGAGFPEAVATVQRMHEHILAELGRSGK